MWRIVFYTEDGLVEMVEVVRKRRPTRLARALMCDGFTHFGIQRVVSSSGNTRRLNDEVFFREKEDVMGNEGLIGYSSGHFAVVGWRGDNDKVLQQGDTVELHLGSGWQAVAVKSGGYKGWYYVLPDGQRARFALSMRARLVA